MPPTLASLVRAPTLRLAVLAGEEHLGAPVRWVHTSELEDPAPFLEGGELLLTTGITLRPDDPAALRRYLDRIADAGVVGLGFGTGLTHERVPPSLVEAAEARGLPLLEVPQPTPFIAISKAVSAALAAEQYQAVTTTFEAQKELTRAALGKDGTAGLLRVLARRLDGWAALYDAAGQVVHAVPGWAVRRAERLTEEVERLRARPAPAGGAVQEPAEDGASDRIELQSLGAGRRPRGFLAVGTGQRLTTTQRYVVNAAAALLTLTLEQSRTLHDAGQRLSAALLRMLLAGQTGHARAVAGTLYGTLLTDPVRVLAVRAVDGTAGEAADRLSAFADRLDQASARAAEPCLVSRDGDRLTVLAADGGAVHRAALAAAGDAEDLAVGISAPAPPEDAADALTQAERALAIAIRRGRSVVRHEETGGGSLAALLDDEAVRAFAEGLLRPLREHDATARGDLVASLHAWLNRHGQWDAAAQDLRVHRHTLRYRIRRAEELLGRPLDDPDVRAELWLALKASGWR